jgi:hypothetical protein
MKKKDIVDQITTHPQTVFQIRENDWRVSYGIIKEIGSRYVEYTEVGFHCVNPITSIYRIVKTDNIVHVPLNKIEMIFGNTPVEATETMHHLAVRHNEYRKQESERIEAQTRYRDEAIKIANQITEALDIDPYFGSATEDGMVRLDLSRADAQRLFSIIMKAVYS